MRYNTANAQNQKKTENIRRYVSRDDNIIKQLEELDNKVKLPGKIVSVIISMAN